MRIFLMFLLAFFYVPNTYSETFISIGDNTVSTGKVIINGQDVSSSFGVKGSGKVTKITRNIGRFSSFESKGSFEIVYRQGALSVEIMGDDNLLDFVKTKVIGDVLMISMDKSYSTANQLVLYISSPEIEHVSIKGTSNVELNGIKTRYLKIDLHGSVDVIANGRVSKLSLNVHGTGDVAARRLIADSAEINLHGSGDIQVNASNELIVKLKGTGDITYYGRPDVVKKDISGVGDIEMGD